ncbi:hypothetical protein BVC80_849g2 [Macleaya cordata]|uniref:Uncharacterized protein n=1 Tax=Macleaya cordata TaxID=56857 RepID=A0A200Q0U7_MACCD|nr:hypothetical protein BVC80_849g2 [Macleaya cordata]
MSPTEIPRVGDSSSSVDLKRATTHVGQSYAATASALNVPKTPFFDVDALPTPECRAIRNVIEMNNEEKKDTDQAPIGRKKKSRKKKNIEESKIGEQSEEPRKEYHDIYESEIEGDVQDEGTSQQPNILRNNLGERNVDNNPFLPLTIINEDEENLLGEENSVQNDDDKVLDHSIVSKILEANPQPTTEVIQASPSSKGS